MKDIKYKKMISLRSAVLFAFLLLLLPACDQRWEEMNTDPNQVVDLPDGYLFTSAIRGTFLDDVNRIQADFGGQYAHIVTSDVYNREIDKYFDIHSSGDVTEEIFRSVYNGAILNITEVMRLTSDGKYKNDVRYAQASIIAAVNFAKLADLFGDIPFTEAAQGKQGSYTPEYDKQEDVYSGLVDMITQSLNVLNNATASQIYPELYDPLYHGQIESWKKFANSLRLRLAMRARFVNPGKYNTIIATSLASPLIETNADNVKLADFTADNPQLYNPWYNKIIDYSANRFTLLWSDMFINTLQSTNDPRLPFFSTKNKNDVYLGMPNGLKDIPYSQWSKTNTSRLTPEFAAKDQPLYLMTAAEIWLLRAEAALFSIGSAGDANAMYQSGIRLAMEQWGIETAPIDTYISTEPEATLTGNQDNQQRQISTQLWIAYVPNFVESWHNIKRTGYPKITQRTNPLYSSGVTNGFLPKRLKYPFTVEKIANGIHREEAIERMGGADRIDYANWWDVIE